MLSDDEGIYGGIEAGGTKFVCAIGTGPDDLRCTTRFATTTPDDTLRRVLDFFAPEKKKGSLKAIGIGSFGPLDLDPHSSTFGYITNTPKEGWRDIDLAGRIRESLDLPVYLDTDVNAAALGEQRWGAGRGKDDVLYLTVGTGIGGGAIVGGRLLHGLTHPEMGHIRVPHDFQRDPFEGCCPFHGDCLEGLAAGPAIQKRWGVQPEELPDGHPGWQLEAGYLAKGIVNYILTLSPRIIVLGGGVARKTCLLPLVRTSTLKLLNRYIVSPVILEGIDSYIVAPELGNLSGVLGALALASGSTYKVL